MNVDFSARDVGITMAQAMMFNAAIARRYGLRFTSPSYTEKEILEILNKK